MQPGCAAPALRSQRAGSGYHGGMHTTSSVLIRELAERLMARGLSAADLEREVGARLPTFRDPDARWPLAAFAALTRLAVRELEDPALGLHVAETLPPERQHVVARIAGTTPTFRDAMADWARYASLVCTADRIRLDDVGDRFRARYLPLPDATPVPFLHEHYLVLARLALTATLGPLAESASFELALPPPPYLDEVRRVLGPRVRFNAPCTSFEIDSAAASAPIRPGDPYLGAVLRSAAERWLEGLGTANGPPAISARVLATLGELGDLDGGALRDRVAQALEMSEKALQRKLQAEGVTFKELLDRHRRERALAWVREGLPTVEIAWRLGFSEIAAFTRAFRRWSGSTVAEVRRAGAADAGRELGRGARPRTRVRRPRG